MACPRRCGRSAWRRLPKKRPCFEPDSLTHEHQGGGRPSLRFSPTATGETVRNHGYSITAARAQDVPFLAAIELAAAQLLRGHAPQSVLDEITTDDDFRQAQASGRLWVAINQDIPVGFALVEMLASDLPHLEEIDIHPDHGRRGVGTALLRTVCDWARRSGYAAITLTTFRAVPWNMSFYSRFGFYELANDDIPPELSAVVADEQARGLDPSRRVVMRYSARSA